MLLETDIYKNVFCLFQLIKTSIGSINFT